MIFLFHTAARWPNGAFETLLALLFWGVAISGVFGIFITRVIPRRLTQAGDEVIYERIPAFRQELREEADRLVLQTVDQSGGTTLAEFHANTLAHYFAGQRSFRSHLTQSSRPLRSLIGQLDDLNRYFNEAEQKAATQLIELIRHKNRLDYHSALQGMLKSWLFVHIPLTYAMLLCAIVHAVIVHAFGGSGL